MSLKYEPSVVGEQVVVDGDDLIIKDRYADRYTGLGNSETIKWIRASRVSIKKYLHPTPCTIPPSPYSRHPTADIPYTTPYTLHPTPCSLGRLWWMATT